MIQKGELSGHEVAFTGRLASMTRDAAAELVHERGGAVVTRVTQRTSLLVLGQEGYPLAADGRLSRELDRARDLTRRGTGPTILSEEEFLERLGLDVREAISRLYTTAQLSRILNVPARRIAAWARAGLIKPAKKVNRLLHFDFREVASAKALSDFARSGVSVERLRDSLEQIRRWLPHAGQTIGQLGILEEHGELRVRLEGGALADPTGQLLLEFGSDRGARAIAEDRRAGAPPPRPRTAEEWFRIATRLEDAGELADAAAAYQQALLAGGPQAETCFNLGNVLYALDRREEAIPRFLQAVELDSQYVEAWNNVGNTLGELGRETEAIDAFRNAISVDPQYADAHYNLAETYFELGRVGDARKHWRAYLALDPYSSWADTVRARLINPGETT